MKPQHKIVNANNSRETTRFNT